MGGGLPLPRLSMCECEMVCMKLCGGAPVRTCEWVARGGHGANVEDKSRPHGPGGPAVCMSLGECP